MTLSPENEHWVWRFKAAETIASSIKPGRFGVKACYLIGSTKNATAGPESDIDLLFHLEPGDNQRESLKLWIDGWSRALGFMNSLNNGRYNPGILDVHYITDEDIKKRTSFAVMINAVTDAARPLPLGEDIND